MVLDMSAKQVDETPRADEENDGKYEDPRNLASLHSFKYFNKTIPQGFFLY